MGKMVGKPPIASKLCRIPCIFSFFATFGGKRELSSMHIAYIHDLYSMHLVCVHGK
jgi:hypothetical protein